MMNAMKEEAYARCEAVFKLFDVLCVNTETGVDLTWGEFK